MYRYSISKKHGSEKLQIRFGANPESSEFRDACKSAFQSYGFEVEFDGSYFYVTHPDKKSEYSKMSIESDQWGIIWGEAAPWGALSENHELIRMMESFLIASGHFERE